MSLARSLALFLVLFSPAAYSAEFLWTATFSGHVGRASSPGAACSAAFSSYNASMPSDYKPVSLASLTNRTRYRATCMWQQNGQVITGIGVNRSGDTCPPNFTENPQTGECEPPPVNCTSTLGTVDHSVALAGLRSEVLGKPASPINSKMCSGGCQYAFSGDGSMTNCGSIRGGDPAQLYCVFRYTGTGQACEPSDEPVDAAAPPNPNPPADPNDPTNPANMCGKGHAWSGTTCVRYFDPDTNDSGNTGGNDNSGGNTGGNNGGSDNGGGDNGSGSGNGSGNGNGNGSGNGSGDGGDGGSGGGGPPTDVSGVEDRLDKIWDSLFGGEYDNSGDGNDAESEAAGESAGSAIGDLLASEGQGAIDAYEEDSKEFLDALPSTVADWFGDGTTVGLRQGLETVLPSASGCNDYKVAFSLGKYNSSLVMPVCEISRYTRLLEWVIYCLTAIGLWRILFSGLRQDDVKASKGGF